MAIINLKYDTEKECFVDFITVKDLAKTLGIDPMSIYQRIKRGTLRYAFKIGHCGYLPRDIDLSDFRVQVSFTEKEYQEFRKFKERDKK